MGLDYSLAGFAELQQRLEQIATDQATKAGQSAVRAGGKVILDTAKANAPDSDVAEGTPVSRHGKAFPHHKIKNSLKVSKVRAESSTQVSVAVHSGKAYQAVWVEFGSIHNTPNPFLLRAINQASQQAIDAMAVTLNKQLIKRGV